MLSEFFQIFLNTRYKLHYSSLYLQRLDFVIPKIYWSLLEMDSIRNHNAVSAKLIVTVRSFNSPFTTDIKKIFCKKVKGSSRQPIFG